MEGEEDEDMDDGAAATGSGTNEGEAGRHTRACKTWIAPVVMRPIIHTVSHWNLSDRLKFIEYADEPQWRNLISFRRSI
jgi:hypothetical protein